MLRWLEENVWRSSFAWNAENLPGVDATAIYFDDPAPIFPVIEALSLELIGLELFQNSTS